MNQVRGSSAYSSSTPGPIRTNGAQASQLVLDDGNKQRETTQMHSSDVHGTISSIDQPSRRGPPSRAPSSRALQPGQQVSMESTSAQLESIQAKLGMIQRTGFQGAGQTPKKQLTSQPVVNRHVSILAPVTTSSSTCSAAVHDSNSSSEPSTGRSGSGASIRREQQHMMLQDQHLQQQHRQPSPQPRASAAFISDLLTMTRQVNETSANAQQGALIGKNTVTHTTDAKMSGNAPGRMFVPSTNQHYLPEKLPPASVRPGSSSSSSSNVTQLKDPSSDIEDVSRRLATHLQKLKPTNSANPSSQTAEVNKLNAMLANSKRLSSSRSDSPVPSQPIQQPSNWQSSHLQTTQSLVNWTPQPLVNQQPQLQAGSFQPLNFQMSHPPITQQFQQPQYMAQHQPPNQLQPPNHLHQMSSVTQATWQTPSQQVMQPAPVPNISMQQYEEMQNLAMQQKKELERYKQENDMLQARCANLSSQPATPHACKHCTNSNSQLIDALKEVQQLDIKVADHMKALQESKQREKYLQSQLAIAHEAMTAQERENARQHSELEAELRALCNAVAGQGKAGSGKESSSSRTALLAQLQDKVQDLVLQLETQEAEVKRYQTLLQRMQDNTSRKELESTAALAEAANQQRAAQQEAARAAQEVALLRKQHESQVVSLHNQIRDLEETVQTYQKSSEDHLQELEKLVKDRDEIKNYTRTLEQRMGRLQDDAKAAAETSSELGRLHKQLSVYKQRADDMQDMQAQLRSIQEENAALVKQVEVNNREIERLKQDASATQRLLTDKGLLLQARDVEVRKMELRLEDTHKRVDASLARQEQLKKQLATANAELQALQAENRELQRQLQTNRYAARQPADIPTPGSPSLPIPRGLPQLRVTQRVDSLVANAPATPARDGASNVSAETVVEDGDMDDLTNENKRLREQVADLQSQLMTQWEMQTSTTDKELVESLQAARKHIEVLEAQQASQQAIAQQLSSQVALLEQQLEAERRRVAAVEHAAAESSYAAASLDVATRECQTLQAALNEKTAEVHQLQQELDNRLAEVQVQKLHADLQDTTEKLAIQVQEVSELQSTLATYEATIAHMDGEASKLQARLDQSEAARDRLSQQLSDTQAAKQRLEAEALDLHGPEGPSARIRQLQNALTEARTARDALREQLSSMEAELEEARNKLQDNEATIYQLDGTLNMYREDLQNAKAQGFYWQGH